MKLVYQFILAIGGIFLLFLAYKMQRRNWKSPTWICALLGIFALICTQDWVQGFFKTHILSLGYEYGEKLNAFQGTVENIEGTINKHQERLDEHQKDIESQQAQLKAAHEDVRAMQDNARRQQAVLTTQQEKTEQQQAQIGDANRTLMAAQAALVEQQQRLGNAETLINSIFTRSRVDRFVSSETNRFCFLKKGDDAVWAVFLLKEVPIAGTLQGYYGNSAMKPPIMALGRNVVPVVFKGKEADWCKEEFYFTYLSDPRNTQVFKTIHKTNDSVYTDGVLVPLPKDKK